MKQYGGSGGEGEGGGGSLNTRTHCQVVVWPHFKSE